MVKNIYMKRILLIIAFSIAIISGCDKNMPEVAPTSITPCLRISSGFSGTKVTHSIQDGFLKSQWEKGDTITVMIKGDYRYYVADQSGETTTFSLSNEHPSGFSAWDGLTAYAITGKRSIQDGNYALLDENMGNQVYSSTKLPMDYQYAKADVRNSEVTFAFSYPCSYLKMSVPKSVITNANQHLIVDITGDFPFILSNNTNDWVNDITLKNFIYNPTTMEGLDADNNWSAGSVLYPNLIMNVRGGRYLSYYGPTGWNYFRIDNSATISFPQDAISSFQDNEEITFYVAFCPEYRWIPLEEDRYLIRLYANSNRTTVLYEKCAPIGSLKNNTIYDVNLISPYHSADYSKDGLSSLLFKSTKGNGIDLVFMGEGYTDLDMGEGGVYERDMFTAAEHLFSYEPLASYKDYFNIYAVNVVSPIYDAHDSDSPLNGVENIRDYFNGVPGINTNVMRAIVLKRFASDVMKNDDPESSSTEPSYTVNYNDGSFFIRMNHRYNTQRILLHEFMHGIAKVGDEYYDYPGEAIDDENKLALQNYHEMGIYLNLDITDDPEQILWSHLMKDSRFAYEGLRLYEGNPEFENKNEGLDIFEGGWNKYSSGVFRPSYYSLMNDNHGDGWMNAPTREALYNHIMQAAFGNDWVYDYESFVSFDEPYRESVKSYLGISSSSALNFVPHKPEKWINHTSPIFDGESPAKSKLTNDRVKLIIMDRNSSL